jgi:hypothetical protein
MPTFDYGAQAELFSAQGRNGRGMMPRYRRFARASDAVQFAVEQVPRASLVGAYLQVGEERYDSRQIRDLYDNIDFPLSRRSASDT